ncbi:MAG: M6 family metalloprotease domain-containing protein [Muribaculaceae bacterium]|nr:M6 family metalloprotease domain-containing protein [Muribaculaceae bacterium]
MKIKHIIAALAMTLPGFMAAVPADPRPRPVTNPDGSTVMVRMHGDEFFHFMTDLDCTRILEKNSRGFVVDAVRGGARLSFSKDNVEMLRAEAELAAPLYMSNDVSAKKRMGGLNTEGRSTYPTVGKGNRSLVVLVEFQDVPFTVENPKEYFTRQLNERGFSDYQASGSAIDYYLASSNGLYEPQFDVYGPVKVSNNASFYAGMGDVSMKSLIEESLTQLHDSGEVDFSNYDLDEDGIVDTVFFYYAGYGQADSDTETIWPHQFDYRWCGSTGSNRLVLDSKRVGPYACANELNGFNPVTGKNPWRDGSEPWVGGIGTFVHEYGHVLGLPDLYDVEYSEGIQVVTPGKWDVMDAGSYNFNGCIPPLMSAYEQWVCRWLEFTDAEDGTHYDLAALGSTDTPSAVRVRIPKNADKTSFESEYFVIESRDNSSNWDRCFPESGLLVWRINYNKNTWTNNTVNSRYGSNVEIIYGINKENPTFAKGNIYKGSAKQLTPSKSYFYWKTPYITDICFNAEDKTGSFDYNMISETPTGAPLLHDRPYVALGTAKDFTLTWDPVEGADSYLLTIKRSSTGKAMGIYDEFNVGDVTSFKVVSVPISYWNNEIDIYVRAVKKIPCSDTSNVVKVVLKDIPRGETAVEGIESDIEAISGGVGCIVAPEGAEVFDLSGKRLPKDALAPGIYIVKFANKTKKVIVR